jgi:hypothetical protein
MEKPRGVRRGASFFFIRPRAGRLTVAGLFAETAPQNECDDRDAEDDQKNRNVPYSHAVHLPMRFANAYFSIHAASAARTSSMTPLQ